LLTDLGMNNTRIGSRNNHIWEGNTSKFGLGGELAIPDPAWRHWDSAGLPRCAFQANILAGEEEAFRGIGRAPHDREAGGGGGCSAAAATCSSWNLRRGEEDVDFRGQGFGCWVSFPFRRCSWAWPSWTRAGRKAQRNGTTTKNLDVLRDEAEYGTCSFFLNSVDMLYNRLYCI
jgi:hypothetical protein